MRNNYIIHTLFIAILIALLSGCASNSTNEIDLSGSWRFKMDTEDRGIPEQWFDRSLPEEVQLPGSMAMNGKGFPVGHHTEFMANNWITNQNPDYVWYEDDRFAPLLGDDEFLYPYWPVKDKYFMGMAWYQKEIEIPEDWDGSDIELYLERPHWETYVWLNNNYLGSQNALGTPHRYTLGQAIRPGKNRITVAVDNRIKEVDVGRDSHSVSDNTQTSWNGIIGDIKLIRKERLRFSDVRIFPDVENKLVRLQIGLVNNTGQSQKGQVSLYAQSKNSIREHQPESLEITFEITGSEDTLEVIYPMGEDVLLWDEFEPNLYELRLTLENPEFQDVRIDKFGMRHFSVDGTRFAINGRPVFLRGTLESAIFPLTGYPPTDVASWEHIMNVARDHGLNHLRFHSWTPPKAAFTAADKMGFYLQIEASSWTDVGYGEPIDQWLYDETERIIQTYGNHPSFVMMAHGNEPHGEYRNTYLAAYLDYWKNEDDRRLYTAGAGWPMIAENDFDNSSRNARIQGWNQQLNSIVNREPPRTDYDWSSAVAYSGNRPLVTHEIGQWCVYPDFRGIDKYTGVMDPVNLKLFQRSLESNHMMHLAEPFLMASGKLQSLLYKADIEAALRTPGLAGFQLLDLQDFTGQGSAFVGVLDAFWEDKGYIKPEEFRRFSGNTVPLARLKERIFREADTLVAQIEVAHFGANPLDNVHPAWQLLQGEEIVASGSLEPGDIPIGNGISLGKVKHVFERKNTPRKLTLEVGVGDAVNSWDIWVYPDNKPEPDHAVLISETLDSETLEYLDRGGSVLLSLGRGRISDNMGGDIGVGFSTIFWNTAWTNNQKPHTLGILTDPTHPALHHFPTEFHANWQWWDALSNSDAIKLDGFSIQPDPVVRIIDDWFSNRSLAMIVEARVGSGRIMISGADLVNNLSERPAAAQLKISLLHYMNNEEFQPQKQILLEDVMKLKK